MGTSLFSNGVRLEGKYGEYLPGPASLEELGEALLEEGSPPVLGRDFQRPANLQTPDGVDPQNLADTGWGVIFPQEEDPEVYEALKPLLQLRKDQANERSPPEGYREYRGESGYRPGQSKADFLRSRKIAISGLADPAMPYYLLLVGGPQQIGFDFQYEMDVARAVGRLHFDSVEDYARYAETVVAAEKIKQERRAAIFGVKNGKERVTELLIETFVRRITETLTAGYPSWCWDLILEEDASKTRLSALLGAPPALLFTAGHGAFVPTGQDDALQAAAQGAIVCSDWSGASPMKRKDIVTARDIAEGTDLAGLILFQFGCFSAATPRDNDFKNLHDQEKWQPPTEAFVAALPKRLLSLPDARGAQAVIGHVDRIWQYSFLVDEVQSVAQNLVFEQTLGRLLAGGRVGWAMDHLNRWHAEYAVQLADLYTRKSRGEYVDPKELALTWLIRNDARNYVVLGDPAARIHLGNE